MFNWIDVNDYSFRCMLLMERFQIRWIVGLPMPDYRRNLGIALKADPAVAWYFSHRCPESAETVERLVREAPEADPQQVRAAQVAVMDRLEDFVVYTTPEQVDQKCDFVYGWDKRRLLEMADFSGKTVLDVGSGSGRLAFAAAEQAACCWTCRGISRDRPIPPGRFWIEAGRSFHTPAPSASPPIAIGSASSNNP